MHDRNDRGAATFALSRFVEEVRTLVPLSKAADRFEWLPDGRGWGVTPVE